MAGKKGESSGVVECCGYPVSIFFIVVNEFCERFSYYGMRAVLVLYFKYFLLWDEDLATSIYHAFVALCYLTPILGAIVADSWLGKFRTIIYLSIVYAIGQIVMAVSAIHDITDTDRNGTPDNMTFHVALSMLGLVLIALGTGGIKPCVSAFGGDQFEEHQTTQRSTFFSVFYLCINAGSLLSTIITPILRSKECGIHSQEQCYPLAFGVPAVLMVISLVVFIAGSGMYVKAAPQGNIILQVCKCIGFAIKNRFKHRSSKYPKREHWMDWASEKYDKLLIVQIKMVLKVLFLYIPLPMFWTLFDQKGSRWTLQATTMDGDIGLIVLQPDQMQTVNPILILTLVPIMDRIVYPLIKKCGFNFSPLKRMTVGMFLAAMAFVAAALVQLQIDKTLPVFPSSSQAQLNLLNIAESGVTVTIPPNEPVVLGASEDYIMFETDTIEVSLNTTSEARRFTLTKEMRQTLCPNLWPVLYIAFMCGIVLFTVHISYLSRFVNALSTPVNVSTKAANYETISPLLFSNYSLIPQGKHTFNITNGVQKCEYTKILGYGAAYTILLPSNLIWDDEIQPNSVSIALQIPQYFLITAGEVVFSVTGLEFSYSQAPSNMKAVLQAGWLFTVAVGNFIVLIVAELAKIPQKWAEYLLFACLLVAVCVIFSIMAYFYTYMDPAAIEAQYREEKELEPEEKEQLEMTKDQVVNTTEDVDVFSRRTKM
uniref:Solute carrier family 15 member 1a n=1 Tax=Denticeps clupeoides TaxID=299321 RepID=A0AAY4CFB1_9TELE